MRERKTHKDKDLHKRFLAKMDLLEDAIELIRKREGIPIKKGFSSETAFAKWRDKKWQMAEQAYMGSSGRIPYPSRQFNASVDEIMKVAKMSERWRTSVKDFLILGKLIDGPRVGHARIVDYPGGKAIALDPGIGIQDIAAAFASYKRRVTWKAEVMSKPHKQRYREPENLEECALAFKLRQVPHSYQEIANQMGLIDWKTAQEKVEGYENWVMDQI